MNRNGLVFFFLFTASYVDDVLIPELDIRHVPFEDSEDVHALHFEGAVFLHAVHDGMLTDGILCQSVSSLDKGFDCTDLSAHLIHAWTENSALYLYRILITVQGGVYTDGVFVHQLKVVKVKLADIEHGVHLPCLTMDADSLCIGIACETSGIAKQGSGAFGLFHLVEHRTLDLTGDIHQSLIRSYGYDIIVLQTDITCQFAVEQEVVDVDIRQQTSIAIHFDISQGTDLIGTASHIERIVDGGKCRHGIGTRHLDFTDDADGDRTCLSDGKLNM